MLMLFELIVNGYNFLEWQRVSNIYFIVYVKDLLVKERVVFMISQRFLV